LPALAAALAAAGALAGLLLGEVLGLHRDRAATLLAAAVLARAAGVTRLAAALVRAGVLARTIVLVLGGRASVLLVLGPALAHVQVGLLVGRVGGRLFGRLRCGGLVLGEHLGSGHHPRNDRA